MAQFKVLIDFSTTVSEDAADELEYLVAEFVQGILNVVANDEDDAVTRAQLELSKSMPLIADLIKFVPKEKFEPIFTPDEVSDQIVKGTNAAFANGSLPYTHLD